MTMISLLRRRVVSMCACLLPFKKPGDLLYLCNEKIHSMLHSASEIMRWGSLIDFEFHEIVKLDIPSKQINTGPAPTWRCGLSTEYTEWLLLRLGIRFSLCHGAVGALAAPWS